MNASDDWSEPANEAIRSAMVGLRLDDGMADRVLSALPDESQTSASCGDFSGLRAVALVAAALVAGLFFVTVASAGGLTERIFSASGAVSAAACLGGICVGLGLFFGAERLTGLDRRLLSAVTRRDMPTSRVDILIVRVGAVALMLSSAVVQVLLWN